MNRQEWHRWFAWHPVLAIDFDMRGDDGPRRGYGPMPPKRLVWCRRVWRRLRHASATGREYWQYQVE